MTGSRDVDLIRRMEDAERRLDKIDAITNMGKGACWILLKIGSILGLIAAAFWAMISEN